MIILIVFFPILTLSGIEGKYNPDAPQPVTWLHFLSELLEDEDIQTLQEYLGCCLLPTNRGQTMMLLKGNGGEGKSRIGVVMQAMLGANLKNGSIAKVERSPFARADLEHELVMVDDDMKMEALKSTHYLKSLITAEMPMDLERKGEQSYQRNIPSTSETSLSARNGSSSRSTGFFLTERISCLR